MEVMDTETDAALEAEKDKRHQKGLAEAVQKAVGKAVEDAKVNHEKEKKEIAAAKEAAKVARQQ